MALIVAPIAQTKESFDASNNEKFYFTSGGGSQVVKNRLTIRDNTTNVVVYQNIVTSYLFEQTLPSGTLTNGTYYNYYFNTYDIDDNMSPNSNVVPFYCYTTPTITFTNYPSDNIIRSSSYTFTVEYNQIEGETLDVLIFVLVDSNNNTIAQQNYRNTNTPPLTFSHTFYGFENNTTYYLLVLSMSVNGRDTVSEKKAFVASYYIPELYSLLSLENKCNEGYIQATSNVIVAEGEVENGSELYFSHITDGNEDNYIQWGEWYTSGTDGKISMWADKYMLDLSDGQWCKFDSGFDVPNGFQMQGFMYNVGGIFITRIAKYHTIGELVGIKLLIKSGYIEGVRKSWLEAWTRAYIDDLSFYGERLVAYSEPVDDIKIDTKFIYNLKVGITCTIFLDVVEVGTGTSSVLSDYTYPTVALPLNISSYFPLDTVYLESGIYDYIDITSDVSREYSREQPIWTYDTRLNCGFSDLNGGNLSIVLSQLTGIKLKRRKTGEFDWVALKYVPITNIEDLSFTYNDCLVPTNQSFDYAVVPVLGDGTEGSYIITSVDSSFDGCYLCDGNEIFKFYNGCIYPSVANSLTVGVHTPIGKKYPVLVYNTENDFESGTFSGNILGYNFEDTRTIDRKDVQTEMNAIRASLKNRKAKILKDWDGRIYLIGITGGITENPDLINGKTNVSFTWVEQGDYNSQSDLYNNGLIEIES